MAAIRKLLTDLWELDTHDDDRTAVAELLLPTEQVEAALVPVLVNDDDDLNTLGAHGPATRQRVAVIGTLTQTN